MRSVAVNECFTYRSPHVAIVFFLIFFFFFWQCRCCLQDNLDNERVICSIFLLVITHITSFTFRIFNILGGQLICQHHDLFLHIPIYLEDEEIDIYDEMDFNSRTINLFWRKTVELNFGVKIIKYYVM